MGITWVDPIDCTPGTTGSFQDVDLDTHIADLPAGVTGVVLEIHSNTGTSNYFAARKNGSTDDRHASRTIAHVHFGVMVGVDALNIFEIYIANSTYQKVYIVGYVTGWTFFTNAYDKSTATTGSYVDVDCSSECPGAIGAIFEVSCSASGRRLALRKKGSTSELYNYVSEHNSYTLVAGLDGSQLCEQKILATTVDLFLVGYMTDGATFITNPTDYSISVNANYQDMTALPAGATGGFFAVISAGYAYSYNIRKNGSSRDIYDDENFSNQIFVECDASQLCEGKIENAGVDFYLVGYSLSDAGKPYYAYAQQ